MMSLQAKLDRLIPLRGRALDWARLLTVLAILIVVFFEFHG